MNTADPAADPTVDPAADLGLRPADARTVVRWALTPVVKMTKVFVGPPGNGIARTNVSGPRMARNLLHINPHYIWREFPENLP